MCGFRWTKANNADVALYSDTLLKGFEMTLRGIPLLHMKENIHYLESITT